jgi:hypothetical protein
MSIEFVILLRLAVPLLIFRYPLAGGVVALLLDGADVILVELFAPIIGGQGYFGSNYHTLDKWLDVYYLFFLLLISMRWQDMLARRTSILLFAFRMIGVLAFELTGMRKILFFFPNLFENFVLFILFAKRFTPHLIPQTVRQLGMILLLLYIPKFFQEYLLHYAQAQPWQWFKQTFL